MVSHSYLFGSLAIGVAASASVAAAPRHIRRSAWMAAVLFSAVHAGFTGLRRLLASFAARRTAVGIGGLLLSVASGVFLWCLPAGWGAGLVQLQMDWAVLLRRYVTVTLAGAVMVGICRGLGANPSLVLTVTMAAVSLGILVLRARYWRLALAGGMAYLTLYLAILKCSWSAFPEFLSAWNWAGLCGVTVLGIPLEEIGWAAGYGAVWPLIMAYALQARMEPTGERRNCYDREPDEGALS